LQTRELFSDKFKVVAILDDKGCPTKSFIEQGDDKTRVHRAGLFRWLKEIATRGLGGWLPASACHEAESRSGIYRLRKGDLRLYFFHGKEGEVVVCCDGEIKRSDKPDAAVIKRAKNAKRAYETAVKDGTYVRLAAGQEGDIQNED
jgi:hypothetical protein